MSTFECPSCGVAVLESITIRQELLVATHQMEDLKSQVATLTNRLTQLESYIKDIAPKSKILPHAIVLAVKSGRSEKCSTCDRYLSSCDC